MQGLVDSKGELFAYREGDRLYTLDGELTGYIEKYYIVDLEGKPVWRLIKDGVYMLDGIQVIGFFTEPKSSVYY